MNKQEKIESVTFTMTQIMKAIARATETGVKEVLHFADAKITIEPTQKAGEINEGE